MLNQVLELNRCINQDRQELYELSKNKNLSDPSVVKVSQNLDRKIFMLQKALIGQVNNSGVSI